MAKMFIKRHKNSIMSIMFVIGFANLAWCVLTFGSRSSMAISLLQFAIAVILLIATVSLRKVKE